MILLSNEHMPRSLQSGLDNRETDVSEFVNRYNGYEAHYVRRLKAKYFSNQTFSGASIFDKETVVDDEVIRSSKDPPVKHFVEALCSADDHKPTTSVGEASGNTATKKTQSRKTG